MCFLPEQKEKFDNFANNKSPVKIRKYGENKKYGTTNVVIEKHTIVKSITNHPFEIREMTQNNTISSFANTTSNQLVNIKGQLTKLFGSKKVFTRSGSVTKQEGLISDATGTIKVVFWEDFVNAAKESMTYAFKQFIYKNDQYGIYIATSKSAPSSLGETEPIKEPLAKPTIGQEILTNKELLVDLLGVSSATQYSSCCSCKKKLQTQKNSLTAHCTSCNLTQKIKHCSRHWVVTLFVQNSEQSGHKFHVTAFNNIVQQLAAKCSFLDSLETITTKDLIDKLLGGIDQFKIVYDTLQKKIIELT